MKKCFWLWTLLLAAFCFPQSASSQSVKVDQNGVTYTVPDLPFLGMRIAGTTPGECLIVDPNNVIVGSTSCGGGNSFTSLIDSGLMPGQCVQTSSGGLLVTSGTICGEDLNIASFGANCTGVNTTAQMNANVAAWNAASALAQSQFTASISGVSSYNGTTSTVSWPSGCVMYINASLALPSNAGVSVRAQGANSAAIVAGATMGPIFTKDGTTIASTLDIKDLILDGNDLASGCLTVASERVVNITDVDCYNPTSTAAIFGDGVSPQGGGVNATNFNIRYDGSVFAPGSQPNYGIINQPPFADSHFDNTKIVNPKVSCIENLGGNNTYIFTHCGGFSGTAYNATYGIDDESPGGTRIFFSYFDGTATAGFRCGGSGNNGSIYNNNYLYGTTSPGGAMGSFGVNCFGSTVVGNVGHNVNGITDMFLYDGPTACNFCEIRSNDSNFGGGVNEDRSSVNGITDTRNIRASLFDTTVHQLNGTREFSYGMDASGTNPIWAFKDASGTTYRPRLQFNSVSGGSDTHLNGGQAGSLKLNVDFASSTNGVLFYTGGTGLQLLTSTLGLAGDFAGATIGGSELEAFQLAAPTLTLTTSTTGGSLAAGTYCYQVEAVDGFGNSGPSNAACITTTGSTSTVTGTHTQTAKANCYKFYGRTSGSPLGMTPTCLSYVNYNLTWTDNGSVTPSGAMPTANTSGNVIATGGIVKNTPTNTVSCAGGGDVLFAEPETGTTGKVVTALLQNCVGAATWPIPTAFTQGIFIRGGSGGNAAASSLATAYSNTSVTITGAGGGSFGFIMFDGW